jgi:hypothetical protein
MQILRSIIAGMVAGLITIAVSLLPYLWLQAHLAERQMLANPPSGDFTAYTWSENVSLLPLLLLGIAAAVAVSIWMFRREAQRRRPA